MARHSGLPALVKYDGVAFTLRQPHYTTNNDRLVFGATNTNKNCSGEKSGTGEGSEILLDSGYPNDAVVVLALPKHLMERLPGFETDDCLFKISSEILKFMRPSSFTSVVNSQPWLDGVVLLSPAAIIRSYALVESDNILDQESSIVGEQELGIGALLEAATTMSSGSSASSSLLASTKTSKTTSSIPPSSGSRHRKNATLEYEFIARHWVHDEIIDHHISKSNTPAEVIVVVVVVVVVVVYISTKIPCLVLPVVAAVVIVIDQASLIEL